MSLFIFQTFAISVSEQSIRSRFGQEPTKVILNTFGTISNSAFTVLRFTLSRFSRIAHSGNALLEFVPPKNLRCYTANFISGLSAFDRWIMLIGAEQKAIPHSDMVLLI